MKPFISRSFVLFAAVLLVGAVGARAEESLWLTDYNKAVAEAKTENKNLLLDFTGSDWCEACMMMEKEVFTSKEFKNYAQSHLVLMRADFPLRKPLPQKLQDQNNELQEKYDSEGYFPTFILVSKNGKVLGRDVGYIPGGPIAFIQLLESMKK